MTETPSIVVDDDLEQRPQSSSLDRAETAFDRESALQSRQEDTNNFEDVIYVTDSTDKPTKSPNVEIKEAYVKTISELPTSPEKPTAGVFNKIAGAVQSLFRWRKMPHKNSRVTPDSGSTFLDAERAETIQNSFRVMSGQTENIQMNNLNSTIATNNVQMQSNCNQSFQSGFSDNNGGKFSRKIAECPSFESNIFSVDSVSNHVPITIENNNNEQSSEDSSSEFSEDSNEDGSQIQLQPTQKKFSFKKFLVKIWRRTYLPDSIFLYCWLLFISFILLYNAWLIPLRASFANDIQNPYQSLWFVIDAVFDICFIIDILIKFRTPFVKHGVYVTDLSTLNYYHAREWTLFLDIAAILPTDLFFIQSVNPYFRLNRMLKVYRAYSFYRMVEIRTWWPNSLRVANLIHIVVIITHYITCIYYSSCVSNGYGSTLSSWAYPDPTIYPNYASLTRRYSHSFFWSLQELAMIGGRYIPEEDWQYAYNIYVNLVGIGLAAYVVGYITMILFGKNSEKFEFERSLNTTRKYMKKRKLPKELRRRVEEFYDYTWNKSEFSYLDEEKMLRHLPISIKEEIAYHGNYNALKELPQLTHCDSSILKSLVSKLKRRTYLPGQFVYKSGDAGTEMFIVNEGVFQIIRERDGQVTGAREGDIFGEMNIFNLRRNHRRTSDVVSCGYSELYVLTADDAHETLAQYPRTLNVILQQAKREKTWLRRKMSQNFYNRHKHRRYFPSNSSNESFKLMNSPSNVQLRLKRHNSIVPSTAGPSTSSGTNVASKTANDSPDSGMPSSRKRSEAELSGITALQNEISESTLPPDLSAKLIGIFQKNLKSFQKSLDEIWFDEYISLKQQLSNTETERDDKAREISRLRQRADNKTQAKMSNKQRDATENITAPTQIVSKPNSDLNEKLQKEKTINPKWRGKTKFPSNINVTRRRALLPTLAGSTDSLNKKSETKPKETT